MLSDINIGKVNLTFNSNLNDLNVIFTLYIHGNIDPEQSMVIKTSTICKINCYLVQTTNMVIITVECFCSHFCLVVAHFVLTFEWLN